MTPAFPFVFGVGVYCFEGMGMVIPIEDAMTNRENFTPILSVVMVIYTTLCILSGGLGYLAFGDETEVGWGGHGDGLVMSSGCGGFDLHVYDAHGGRIVASRHAPSKSEQPATLKDGPRRNLPQKPGTKLKASPCVSSEVVLLRGSKQ